MVKITKTIARTWLADVAQEKRFYCSDRRVLQNLAELEAALQQMSEETFRYHSNETKTDFSNWIMDVIGDDQLSQDLQKSKTRLQAAKAVANRIAWLKKR